MGGINGCELSVGEVVAIGEKIRGKLTSVLVANAASS